MTRGESDPVVTRSCGSATQIRMVSGCRVGQVSEAGRVGEHVGCSGGVCQARRPGIEYAEMGGYFSQLYLNNQVFGIHVRIAM